MENQWNGKKVGFIGDSITDKNHIGTTKNYWQYLEESLGLTACVYGINGETWDCVVKQAETMKLEQGADIDAIFVFMGTNDYNSGVPLGDWWNFREEDVDSHGILMRKRRRYFNLDHSTFRGRINVGMKFLKENYPVQQIVLITPIHRGYANFSGTNIQPEESFPNDINLFFETYVESVRQAGDIWSVPVIDLYRTSGLFPTDDRYVQYFHDAKTDRLHPNAEGHRRMAETMRYQMLTLPANFR